MDFILIDRDTASSTRDALAHIRLETLDIYNRLHSIAEDVLLVNFIHENYPDLPILRQFISFCLRSLLLYNDTLAS